ncbi:MAG: hypothetical protein JKY89_12495 [Immundisolibacteraceae bacterium]|nr:hypothetical protein [Immundisolibacteraceae bacterium]
MLREIPAVRQIKGEPDRRWFSSIEADLLVWHVWDTSNIITGFQFTYDKSRAEKVVTWQQTVDGLQHMTVDDGEQRPGKPKSTPILVTSVSFDPWHVCGLFLRISADLPREIRNRVCAALISGQGNL